MYEDFQKALAVLLDQYPQLNSIRFHRTNVIVAVIEEANGHEKYWRQTMAEVLELLESKFPDGDPDSKF